MAQILDGRLISKQIKEELKEEVQKILQDNKRPPCLVAILVGEDGASKTYVNSKAKDCAVVGFASKVVRYPESVSEAELLEKVAELNQEDAVDGFIVQLPLPKHIDQEKVIMAIDPDKDVDGFHPANFGKMALEMPSFLPATPFGIMTLLERYKIETSGKNCVVVGRSKIVGRPMSILLSRKGYPGDATVTVVHSHTKDLTSFTKAADIVIAALGKPLFLKANMIKEGAVVIDVGITRVNDNSEKGYHLAGDVDFEECQEKASWITPVPGGVGPMTRAMLLQNTMIAYQNHQRQASKDL